MAFLESKKPQEGVPSLQPARAIAWNLKPHWLVGEYSVFLADSTKNTLHVQLFDFWDVEGCQKASSSSAAVSGCFVVLVRTRWSLESPGVIVRFLGFARLKILSEQG